VPPSSSSGDVYHCSIGYLRDHSGRAASLCPLTQVPEAPAMLLYICCPSRLLTLVFLTTEFSLISGVVEVIPESNVLQSVSTGVSREYAGCVFVPSSAVEDTDLLAKFSNQ